MYPKSTPKFYATDSGYDWYDECNCCPYGYHIDLDFVRYCESVSKEADRSGSVKRRRDRRRQRQSMEVLLGINAPTHLELDQKSYKTIQEQEAPKIIQKQTRVAAHPAIHDAFDDAVSDFERTLQRSKNKLSHNLPDVTAVSEALKRAPSNSSMSSTSGSSMTVLAETVDGAAGRDFDTVSIESCGLSPLALHNIREQMALSLERTKQLEDEVKLIPHLKDQLAALREENHKLTVRLRSEQATQNLSNTVSANYVRQVSQNNRIRSQSFTNIDSLEGRKREPPPPPPRKDFGVMCGVLTRNVGVGHQNPSTKTVSTATLGDADKWYSEKVKFMNHQNLLVSGIAKSVQTVEIAEKPKEQRTIASQTAVAPITRHGTTQTVEEKKLYCDAASTARPKCVDFGSQKRVEVYNIATSEDTVDDVICDKCSVLKITVGVGPDSSQDAHTCPVSLANLMGPRSKSFNLGEDKINFHTRNRTVACQYEPTGISKASQSVKISSQSKACQRDFTLTHKGTQSEQECATKHTDTKDLQQTRHVACEAVESKAKTAEAASNTPKLPDIQEDQELDSKSDKPCSKCSIPEKEEIVKKDGSPTPSRIPRPQIPATTVEFRKFRRQDTYTKLYSPPPSATLSGLDLSPKAVAAEPTSPLEKVKQHLNLSPISSVQNGDNTPPTRVQVQETTLPMPETALFNSSTSHAQRKKAVPSKEMQGAMKVLNDSLQKSHAKNPKNQSAINIIQQEWFKISSLVTANPLDVEDYLDAFEDMSSILLEYIVNMIDDSGNTAMHYAVSHGNFDVVSILLDSKVCDINKPNKAGYTSVMLVSLAEVRSQTHANVVRRLFQMADVNIRARQHGQTALMLAVSHGRLDMVKMLLEAGADINIQDEDGSTALMCAAEHGHIEIVKHFLSQPDCDSNITDVDGSTALKIAMEASHRHIGVLLYAHQRNLQMLHGKKKSKPSSPKTPSSPLPLRSSHRALTDTKPPK